MDGGRFDGSPAALPLGTSRRGVLRGLVGGALLGARSRGVAAQCEPVELHPGYPGYRGYVTGLDGVGDHACVEQLLAADPGFHRATQDSLNLGSAARLGLAGLPDEWTWENWLSIEAERGLPPTCYACAIAAAATRPEPVGTPLAPDDPRLLIGGYGTDWAFGAVLARRFGASSPAFGAVRQLVPFDHTARAIIGMANPHLHVNARQMLAAYEDLTETLTTPGVRLDTAFLLDTLLAQGGTPRRRRPRRRTIRSSWSWSGWRR